MAYIPKNILITGGCGFIGSNFINYIFHKWDKTNFINVDKLILNSDARYISDDVIFSGRYKLITCDIKNSIIIKQALVDNQIDTIIHFAADCTSTRCYEFPIESLENNTISFIKFFDVIRSYGFVRKFIHISTDEVYGDSNLAADEKGKMEDSVLSPGNTYAATKAACESFAHSYRLKFGLPIIILRINNIYGPNQWDVKLVPRYIELAVNKEKFTVQGTGEQLRSWLFVDDASEGIRVTVEKGEIGEIYNLGTYFEMNILDVARKIQSEVDKQLKRQPVHVEFITIPDRPYNDLRYLLDINKVNKELGWTPKIPFDEGIRRIVESTLKPKLHSQRMKVIIYGGNGWIGQQMQKMLRERKIPFLLAKSKLGVVSDAEVIDELNEFCGTHVLCCIGRTHGGSYKTIEYLEGGPDKTYENVRDNLYSVTILAEICYKLGLHYTYIGTGYLFSYDKDHPIGGEGFKDNDLPNFYGNSYSVVKGFTDQMMKQFNGGIRENLNARITLPLNFELIDERNLLTKIIGYKQIFDIPVSITILDDCIPALLKLMEKRFGGNLNLVNPIPISLHEILQLYKKIVDPTLPDSEVFDASSDKGKHLLSTKANCTLDTTLLKEIYPGMPTSIEGLQTGFKKLTLIGTTL